MQKAGAGLYVATTSEPGKSKKPTPNNEGKSYHKWTMQQRDLLLRECLFQQVWTAPHKQKQQTWSNICIILNNLPNIGDEFATVDWRKCQDEFTKNVELFLTSKDAHHFKSGTAEEHTVWQDLMEEITQLMYPSQSTGTQNSTKKQFVEKNSTNWICGKTNTYKNKIPQIGFP